MHPGEEPQFTAGRRIAPPRRGLRTERALLGADGAVTMDIVELGEVEVLIETDLALLCLVRGKEVWIPREQIRDRDGWHAGHRGTLVIPRWLALYKGLV